MDETKYYLMDDDDGVVEIPDEDMEDEEMGVEDDVDADLEEMGDEDMEEPDDDSDDDSDEDW